MPDYQARELAGCKVSTESYVGCFYHFGKRQAAMGKRTNGGVKMAHHKTRTEAFSRDIADQEEQALTDIEDIRVVSANQSRRLIKVMAMPAFKTPTQPVEARSLDARREPEVAFQSLLFVQRQVVQPEVWRFRTGFLFHCWGQL
jgi:hypothetical protein